MQAGEDEVTCLASLQHPLPHRDSEITILMLEVIAEYRDKSFAAKCRNSRIKIGVRGVGGTGSDDVVQAEGQRLHALRIKAWHLS